MEYLSAQPVVQFDNLLVVTYDYVLGSHVAENTSDFIPILKMLGALHADHVVHGDIRLSNIVFAGMQSSLIDFDFSGKHGEKKYPAGYNREIFDGFRHADAKENSFLELKHDFYALSGLMNLFSTTESSEEWSVVCNAVSNGEIEIAIQMLDQLQIPIRCANTAIIDRLNATGSLQNEQSLKKRRRSKSSRTSRS
jgi:serine/threonine protein kinase